MKSFARFLLYAGILCFAVALLLSPAEAARGALAGVRTCLDTLVPSLFPFMVLAVFVVKSGAAQAAGRRLQRPSHRLLRLPGGAAATVLMAMVGGYPVGARGVAALRGEGVLSEEEAARMLCFCVCAGPGFVMGVVGVGFLRSAWAGAVLLAAEVSSALVLGVLCGLRRGKHAAARPAVRTAAQRPAAALLASTTDAARSMLVMCALVVLFAAALALLGVFVRSPAIYAALYAALEVTGGCARLAALHAPLWAVALALGWGGLCVQLQVLACAGSLKINVARFFAFRLLHGAMAAFFTAGLCRLLPGAQAAFSTTALPARGRLSGSVPAAAALLLLCVVFLFSMSEKTNVKKCYNKGH